MKYRILGRTGLRVSEVGFGGGGIGGVWGETTAEESIRAIHRALELGINFFDVAPGYGSGQAEEVLGQALVGQRDKVYITTKVSVPRERFDDLARYAQESLEASLRRLRTDHVDILLVHNSISSKRSLPFAGSITAADALALAEAFGRLREAGKVRYIGFTAWRCNRHELKKMIDSGAFDVLQTEYNILNQSAMEPPPPGFDIDDVAELEKQGVEIPLLNYRYKPIDQCAVIPQAVAKSMGIICIRPLLAGLISDGLDRPLETGRYMEKMMERASKLAFLRRGGKQTLSRAGMVFCLMNPHISTIVPGVKRAQEIEEAAACSGAPPLTKAELKKISELYRRNLDVP